MKHNALYTRFDSVFFEKTRLSLLTILYREDNASYSGLKEIIGGTDGSVFTHLQKLQEAGYISQKKEIIGTKGQTFYSLTEHGKKEFKRYIEFMNELLRKK